MRPLQKSLNLTHFYLLPFYLFFVTLPLQVVIGQAAQAQMSQQSREAEADLLLSQGTRLQEFGRYRDALQDFEKALQIYSEIKDLNGIGNSFGSLGKSYISLGEYQKAIDYLQKSLHIHQQIGNRFSEAISLNNLGIVYDFLGQYKKSIDYYQKSLVIAKQIFDRGNEGYLLNNLCLLYTSPSPRDRTRSRMPSSA